MGGRRRRKRAEWLELLEASEASGQSDREFAEEQGLVVGTLRWWRWRLKGSRELHSDRPRFLEVRPMEVVEAPTRDGEEHQSVENEHPRARLALPGGVLVELAAVPHPEWMAALSRALEVR